MWWWWSNDPPFFAHKKSFGLACQYHHVVLMDCTYKPNKYRLPLLHIVGMTRFNNLFSAGYCFFKKRSKTITCGHNQNLQPSWHQRHDRSWLRQTVNCRWWQLSIKNSHLHHTCCAHGTSTKTSCLNANDNLRRASNETCFFSSEIIWWLLTRKWNLENSRKSY